MGIIDAISTGIWNFGAPLLMIVGAFFTLGSGFYQLRRARSVCSLLRRQDGEAQAGLTPSRPFPPRCRAPWARAISSGFRRRWR